MFENTGPPVVGGTLQLIKRTSGGDGTFAFTSAELSNPSLTTSGGVAQTAAATVNAGTYTLAEAAAAGWDLSSIACTGNATAATVNLASRNVSVPVAAGENVICTFNNARQQGTLQLVKRTTGGDGTFAFTSAELSNPSLTTSGGTAQTAATSVTPGTYTLAEAATAGWDLSSIACTGNASAATVNLAARNVSVPVAAGENVVCTFNNAPTTGTLQLIKRTSGGDGTFAFASTAATLGNPSLTTSGGIARTAVATVTPATYTLTEAAATGWDLSSIACTGNAAAATVSLAARNVSVPVAANETVVCTFTNTEVKRRTEAIIHNFMARRADAITSNGPRADRMIDRLSQDDPAPQQPGSIKDDPSAPSDTRGQPMKLGGAHSAAQSCDRYPSAADPVPLLRAKPGEVSPQTSRADCEADKAAAARSPVAVTGSGDETQGRLAFAGSLSQSQRARDADKMALGATGAGAPGSKSRFDVWTEGTYVYMESDKAAVSGHFGLVSAGVDYLLRPGILIGAMAQFDSAEERSKQLGYAIKGHGWMVGPYAGIRLSPNLYLDGRALWGRSANEVSPFLTYTDPFDTTRWLLSARLTGRWTHGAWTFQPSAEVIKFHETSSSYTDSLGIAIDSQTVDLGRVIFGPELSYTFRREDGLSIVPRAALRGIWDFERPGLVGIDASGAGAGPVGAQDPFRARLEAGLGMTDAMGRRLDLSTTYDGIGRDDVRAVSGKAKLTLPF